MERLSVRDPRSQTGALGFPVRAQKCAASSMSMIGIPSSTA